MATSTEDERELIEAARTDPARFGEVYDRYVAALDRSEGAVKQLQLRAIENLRKGMGVHG